MNLLNRIKGRETGVDGWDSRTFANGVELPGEFAGASITASEHKNDDGRTIRTALAVSLDRKAVARIGPYSEITIGEMPEDKRLDFDGGNVDYSDRGGFLSKFYRRMQDFELASRRSGWDAHVTGPLYFLRLDRIKAGQAGVWQKTDTFYGNVKSIGLERTEAGDINLGISKGDKVHVRGFTRNTPENREGHLYVKDLDGLLEVPVGLQDLTFSTYSPYGGNVKGAVACGGDITAAGNIELLLKAPLRVEARVFTGNVSVRGMQRDKSECGLPCGVKATLLYIPPNAAPIGTLRVETSCGNVRIAYAAKPKGGR